jgi:dsRNA-specific ribonuclease
LLNEFFTNLNEFFLILLQYLPSILWRLEASLSVFDFLITSQHLMRSEMDPSSESPVHEAYLSKLVETNFPGCALVSLSSPIQPLQCRTFISSLTGSGASHLKNSNYERLEHLGDCFLKYAIGVSLFLQYPHLRESRSSFIFSFPRML